MGSTERFFAAIEAGRRRTRCVSMVRPSPRSRRRATRTACRRVMRARYRLDHGAPRRGALGRSRARRVRCGIARRRRSVARSCSTPIRRSPRRSPPTGSPPCTSRRSSAASSRRASCSNEGRTSMRTDAGWMTGTPLNSAAAGRHADVRTPPAGCAAPTRTRDRRAAGPRCIRRRTTATWRLVELLLARGADPAAANDDGATVLSMAEESGNADVDRPRPRRARSLIVTGVDPLSRRTRTPARPSRTGSRGRT